MLGAVSGMCSSGVLGPCGAQIQTKSPAWRMEDRVTRMVHISGSRFVVVVLTKSACLPKRGDVYESFQNSGALNRPQIVGLSV